MKNDAIERACKLIGGQAVLAAAINVSPQAVNKWIRTGRVPAIRVIAIETASGVTRSDLRPDIYPPEDRRTTERRHA